MFLKQIEHTEVNNFQLVISNLELREGFHGIAGAVGSGKTSFLTALVNELKLVSGNVCV
jgi:Ni2+-binding GTPase involved in maturation of urease and hydrogenase